MMNLFFGKTCYFSFNLKFIIRNYRLVKEYINKLAQQLDKNTLNNNNNKTIIYFNSANVEPEALINDTQNTSNN